MQWSENSVISRKFFYIDIYAKSILCIIHGCKSDLPDKLITLNYCYSEDHPKGA